jgi:phage shock protein A
MLSREFLKKWARQLGRAHPGDIVSLRREEAVEIMSTIRELQVRVAERDTQIRDMARNHEQDVDRLVAHMDTLKARVAELETRVVDAEHGFKLALGDSGEYRRQAEELQARVVELDAVRPVIDAAIAARKAHRKVEYDPGALAAYYTAADVYEEALEALIVARSERMYGNTEVSECICDFLAEQGNTLSNAEPKEQP